MQIARSDEQRKNTDSPILLSFELLSNVTSTKFRQVEKHSLSSFITDAGIQIDTSDEQARKVDSPNSSSCDSSSMVPRAIVTRLAQFAKHWLPMDRSREGSQIVCNAAQPENAIEAIDFKSGRPGSNVTLERFLQFMKHSQ
jgi:hypothetical protein